MAWTYSLAELAAAIECKPVAETATFSSISTDTRTLRAGDVFFALTGANFDANAFVGEAFAKGACAVVASRAHSSGPCLVVDDPLQALQRFAAWHRARFSLPVLAITGSCGKTTTKDLIAELLAPRFPVAKTPGNLNNDIGVPLSLMEIDAESGFAVIEMGANHQGEIAALCGMARPTEAAITMIAPAHLEGFGSIENVAAAKAEIVRGLGSSGVFYVNTGDPRCVAIGETFAGECVRFGESGDVTLRRREFLPSGDTLLEIDPVGPLALPLACPAHVTNVLLAVAVGLRHGATEFEGPLRKALAAATRFQVLRIGPWVVLDDSYNANPASMAAALEALALRPGPGLRVAALGDMLELGKASRALHRELGRTAAAAGVQHLFARGAFANEVVAGALKEGCPHACAIESHADIAAAVHALEPEGGTLLVKGSRGMRMERVFESLKALYG
ncbi:MAG TPA: UDP-N-acetylmuramoyl-tripeptide--D-alanyl-D-alanine ligase [Candidatus Hydrogenedentes bacterium]|jgi:UDP-N-acetylmuramoyl-tripeptide--D-alanyl-D-alanine ligase|nr:UDP-N-acetylmuramoyl-tripeptide--D-alanyl-D-alanine ligase [Candidatus Hydrogenedentota bacterium]HPK00184.1 UDP-N-acetylmuramoyl-tripeptide--D-alanyl-D-alanine ligase [Candidatus Hydrogenedentota bacterium]